MSVYYATVVAASVVIAAAVSATVVAAVLLLEQLWVTGRPTMLRWWKEKRLAQKTDWSFCFKSGLKLVLS